VFVIREPDHFLIQNIEACGLRVLAGTLRQNDLPSIQVLQLVVASPDSNNLEAILLEQAEQLATGVNHSWSSGFVADLRSAHALSNRFRLFSNDRFLYRRLSGIGQTV
jgi:hypothetical protein